MTVAAASVTSGCARFNSNDHPLLSTLAAFVPFGSTDVSKQAGNIQYATIDLRLDGRGGLLVLAQQQPGITYWQSSREETVVLSRGYLTSTAGLEHNLLSTRLEGLAGGASIATPFTGPLDSPHTYEVTRTWQADDGRAVSRTAQADLTCAPDTAAVQLPLAKLPLRKCTETLAWAGAGNTESTYWIDPKDNRIWKARTQPWPHGPTVQWQIARPWW